MLEPTIPPPTMTTSAVCMLCRSRTIQHSSARAVQPPCAVDYVQQPESMPMVQTDMYRWGTPPCEPALNLGNLPWLPRLPSLE
jgi:hypothetical protein